MNASLRHGCFVFLAAAGIWTWSAAAAAAQGIVLRGQVVERGTSEAIAGAAVELSGVGQILTNPRGEFFFSVPRPARRNLTVSMIGYRQHRSAVTVRSDTTIRIELEIEAVRLDQITVRDTRFTLRGEVTDVDNRPVADADVHIGVNKTVRTNLAGRFKVGGLPAADTTTVQVVALGLMPHVIQVHAQRDTTLRITLQPDPIGQRMMAMQVERLQTRVAAVGHSVSSFDRAELMLEFGSTLYDLVRRNLRASQRLPTPMSLQRRPQPIVPCLFIDERRALFGLDELYHYLPETVERIEIIDRGTMVRIYTRRYIQEMMRRRAQPQAIVLAKGTGAPICH